MEGFGVGSRIRADWQLLRIAQDGNTVLTERFDILTAVLVVGLAIRTLVGLARGELRQLAG